MLQEFRAKSVWEASKAFKVLWDNQVYKATAASKDPLDRLEPPELPVSKDSRASLARLDSEVQPGQLDSKDLPDHRVHLVLMAQLERLV